MKTWNIKFTLLLNELNPLTFILPVRVTKFKINWDGSEGATENSENVPPKRDPNQLSDNSQVLLVLLIILSLFFQSMDTPLKSTNGLTAAAPMEIE